MQHGHRRKAGCRTSRYINLGDWIKHFTYTVFDGGELKLMKRNGDGPLSADVRITGGPAE